MSRLSIASCARQKVSISSRSMSVSTLAGGVLCGHRSSRCNALITSDWLHPAKQYRRIFSGVCVIAKLGLWSSWAGQQAIYLLGAIRRPFSSANAICSALKCDNIVYTSIVEGGQLITGSRAGFLCLLLACTSAGVFFDPRHDIFDFVTDVPSQLYESWAFTGPSGAFTPGSRLAQVVR